MTKSIRMVYQIHNETNEKCETVVVEKEGQGYGLKVSGDKPIYIAGVKPGGAAEKAGLKNGDKIVKVNGQDVLDAAHSEVVDIFRASSQVSLTVVHKDE